MTLDHRLLDLLVCPLCKGPLTAARDERSRVVELHCAADRLAPGSQRRIARRSGRL